MQAMRHNPPRSTWLLALAAIVGLLIAIHPARAQGDLAAVLEVLQAGVEVQRVNTTSWLPVRVEAIVGVGDRIRTDATGRARITFFSDGTDTELLPNTEYRIQTFSGTAETFTITAEVVVGQTLQRLSRILDSNSSYNILTPGMGLVARGTQFAIRVEDSGRSAMLVSEGQVEAHMAGSDNRSPASAVRVEPGFGVRAAVGAALSDVVRARTFEELDAALDGCTATLTTPDDASLNVRAAPATSAELLGYLSAAAVTRLFGRVADTDWYRVAFADSPTGYGWILSSTAVVDSACAGLRDFPADHVEVPAEPAATSSGDDSG